MRAYAAHHPTVPSHRRGHAIHGHVGRCLLASFVAVLITTLSHAGDPIADCILAKRKATAKEASSLLICHAKATKAGDQVSSSCTGKVREQFAEAFAKAEAKAVKKGSQCATTGDAETVEDAIEMFVADVASTLRPNPDASKGTAAKLSAVSKYAIALLGKNPIPIAKAEASLASAFLKAETKSNPQTSGDAGILADKVEQFAVSGAGLRSCEYRCPEAPLQQGNCGDNRYIPIPAGANPGYCELHVPAGSCMSGACVGGTAPNHTCSDEDDCSCTFMGYSDGSASSACCVAGAPCDNSLNAGANACSQGECSQISANGATTCSNVPLVCDDGRSCSTDSCDPATGCVFDSSNCNCANEPPCPCESNASVCPTDTDGPNNYCVESSCHPEFLALTDPPPSDLYYYRTHTDPSTGCYYSTCALYSVYAGRSYSCVTRTDNNGNSVDQCEGPPSP